MRMDANVDLIEDAVPEITATYFDWLRSSGSGWLVLHFGTQLNLTGKDDVVVAALRAACAEAERAIAQGGSDLPGGEEGV